MDRDRRETMIKFMEVYKLHTCLWNVSNPDYKSQNKRLKALQDLVPILGKDATIASVRKKIDIIRNGYFRELKKVNASKTTETSPEDVYAPTLWYYDYLTFLSPEESRPGTDGIVEPEKEKSGQSQSPIKRNKRRSTNTQQKFINIAKKLLNEDDSSNQDTTFGLYLNQQLQKLPSDQRTFAEKLMSDVLFMARRKELNTTSQIVSHQPHQANVSGSSSPISDINSLYAQDVPSPPDIRIYKSAYSSPPVPSSPCAQDVCSNTDTDISTPIIISKRYRTESHKSPQYSSSPSQHIQEMRRPSRTYSSRKRRISQNTLSSSQAQ